MPRSKFVTRKEIASANEVSERTIRRRERSIGLNDCRDKACTKPARFERAAASEKLRRNGLKSPD